MEDISHTIKVLASDEQFNTVNRLLADINLAPYLDGRESVRISTLGHFIGG